MENLLLDASQLQVIALEGVDGVGKSHCCKAVAVALNARGTQVFAAAEFESPVGDWLSKSRKILTSTEKILYFAADRASTLRELELLGPQTVLWDRYVLSSHAYRLAEIWQRSGLDSDARNVTHFIDQVNSPFPKPALTIWLRMEPKAAEKRSRPGHDVRLDLVDRAYSILFANLDSPWVEVDASRPAEEVVEMVTEMVLRTIEA